MLGFGAEICAGGQDRVGGGIDMSEVCAFVDEEGGVSGEWDDGGGVGGVA